VSDWRIVPIQGAMVDPDGNVIRFGSPMPEPGADRGHAPL
jgi:hypothetical protein